ncbi:MAG: Bax inhibitor-1/YccA family protein [Proteobacteria bacterium]|nr:Bax inhibitor-1/YccA family protein [Pseudomonadota bacterium]
MSNHYQDPISRASVSAINIDQGLRSYMIKIYNTMTIGLSITGLVAYFISTQPQIMNAIFASPLAYVVMFAPLIMVFLISAKLHTFEVGTLRSLFLVYATLMGVSLSAIFLAYTGESIVRVFFITSSMFLTTSIWGYTTRADLTKMGSFLMMGLFGIIIASIVNIFMQSTVLDFTISAIGVVVFTGLTAYDSQRLKEIYDERDSSDTLSRKVIFGALNLYLNFINLFLSLLRLFGDRR